MTIIECLFLYPSIDIEGKLQIWSFYAKSKQFSFSISSLIFLLTIDFCPNTLFVPRGKKVVLDNGLIVEVR